MKACRSVGAGFSLVEVTMALGIISICLITLVGVIPVGITNNRSSVDEGAAANIARMIEADLRNTPATATASSFYGIVLASLTPKTLYFSREGTLLSGKNGAVYRADVQVQPAGPGGGNSVPVRAVISWPALTRSPQDAWPTEFTGCYHIVTALAR